jgi:hypothetical protein
MTLVGLVTLLVVGLLLARIGATRRRLYGVLLAIAVSPLVVGPVLLNTYDPVPALLVVSSLAALVWRRDSFAFALLGVAIAAKLYPVALVPLFALWLWRTGRSLVSPLMALGAAVLVLVGPFAVLGWDGLVDGFRAQAGRGLQVESLGGATLLASDRLGLYNTEVVHGSTAALSRDLDGALPDALAIATSFAQLGAVALVLWLFLRARPTDVRLIVATAATLTGFLVFARFISPQYLVWLVPIVPLAGVVAAALLGVALLLGRLWFFHYRDLFAVEGIAWLVAARDLVLLGLYGLLVKTMIPSRSKTFRQAPPASSRASGTAVVDGSERRSR